MSNNCPICRTKLSKLTKAKIKDDIICTNCMGTVPFKDQMKKGNKNFSLEEVKYYVEMKASGNKSVSTEKEESTGIEPRKPKRKKWLIWALAAVAILGIIGSLTDNENEEVVAEDDEVQVESVDESEEPNEEVEESNEIEEQEESESDIEEESEEPKTIEDEVKEILSYVMGAENIVSLEVFDYEDSKMVETTLNASENFTINQIKTRMTSDSTNILERLFALEDIEEVILNFDLPLTDQGGNEEVTTVLTVMMDREHEENINWDNFVYINLPDVAKGFAEHPAIRD